MKKPRLIPSVKTLGLDRKRSRKTGLSEDGFTLLEALIAMAVMVIGVVGLLAAASRTTISAVKTWDRTQKTFIAQSRLEEHKALLYQDYRPEMPMSTYKPVRKSNAVAVTCVEFTGNTLTISATDNLLYSCETNSYVTQNTGFALSFPPTPGWNANDYYQVADAAGPTTAWVGRADGGSECNQLMRNISFNVDTPLNQGGQLTLWFVDYGDYQRSQQIKVGGVVRSEGIFGPDTTPISTTPTAPTTFSLPISRFDTNTGKIPVVIEQLGVPNDWGFILDSGNNETGISIICPENSTPTHTPTPGSCVPNTQLFEVQAEHNSVVESGFSTGGSTTRYIYPTNSTAWAYYEFLAPCTGSYRISAYARCFDADNTTNNSLYVSITDQANNYITSNSFGGVNRALWEIRDEGYNQRFVSHRGNATNDSTPQYTNVTWNLTANQTYRIRFERAEANNYLRLDRFRLWYNNIPPTPTFTTIPVSPTPTPTINVCTFPAAPTPIIIGTNPNYAPGHTPVPCDSDILRGLAASGIGGDQEKMIWETKDLIDAEGDPGIQMDHPGKITADIRLMAGMSVTMRVDFTVGQPIEVALLTVPTSNWYSLEAHVTGVGRRIAKIHFEFANVSRAAIQYVALDAVRVVYNKVFNPNTVLSGIRFSALDTYIDTVTYAPFIVESRIKALETEGSAGGYVIQVVVRDPRGKDMPLTLTNTISP